MDSFITRVHMKLLRQQRDNVTQHFPILKSKWNILKFIYNAIIFNNAIF